MFRAALNLLHIADYRRKLFLTFVLLLVYRMGFWMPLPTIDQEVLREKLLQMQEEGGGGLGRVMQVVALFSASRIGNATVFGLGIMPYISASIIFQLLAQVYPPLEAIQKDGESGRRRINEYTRYATVLICLGQSLMWIGGLASGKLFGASVILESYNSWYWHLATAIGMTCGTMVLVWIAEQIDAFGIGNGVSLLIMAGIVANIPASFGSLIGDVVTTGVQIGTEHGFDRLLMLAAMFVAVVALVVVVSQGQRKIPVQSARHAQRAAGSGKQFMPLRVNQAGVMPVIFASSLLMLPYFVFNWLSANFDSVLIRTLNDAFSGGRGFLYTVLFISLIYFFCYFWTAVTFNPKEIAANLKDHGSFIPGYRPGARSAKYLESVMLRITYIGAAFLSLLALVPTAISSMLGVDPLVASYYGGTGLLIVVSVVLETVQRADSQLVMHNYPSILQRD